MLIVHRSERIQIKNDHPLVEALLSIARIAARSTVDARTDTAVRLPKAGTGKPIDRDAKAVWRAAKAYRKLLRRIAFALPEGIGHRELAQSMSLDSDKFRGMQIGLARICKGLGVENPVLSTGYNATNRVYMMRPDIGAAFRALSALTKLKKKKTRS